jgi:MFS family permease
MLIAYAVVVPTLIFPLLPTFFSLLAVDLVCSFAISAGGTAGIAAIQDAAPNDMRGIFVSIQAMFYTTLGLGLGPTAVALVTDNVFRSPDAVGLSVVVVTMPLALVAVLLTWAALKPYRATRARYAADQVVPAAPS